jgi:hypothetical protein
VNWRLRRRKHVNLLALLAAWREHSSFNNS